MQGIEIMGKAFGWPDDKIQKHANLKYTMVLEATPGGVKGSLDYDGQVQNYDVKFGEAFDWIGVDGNVLKLTIKLEGGVWTEEYSPDGTVVAMVSTRKVEGGSMSVVSTFPAAPGVSFSQVLVKE